MSSIDEIIAQNENQGFEQLPILKLRECSVNEVLYCDYVGESFKAKATYDPSTPLTVYRSESQSPLKFNLADPQRLFIESKKFNAAFSLGMRRAENKDSFWIVYYGLKKTKNGNEYHHIAILPKIALMKCKPIPTFVDVPEENIKTEEDVPEEDVSEDDVEKPPKKAFKPIKKPSVIENDDDEDVPNDEDEPVIVKKKPVAKKAK